MNYIKYIAIGVATIGYLLNRIGIFGRNIVILCDISSQDLPYGMWIYHNHISNKNYILFNRYEYWVVDNQYLPLKQVKAFSIKPLEIHHHYGHGKTIYCPEGVMSTW